MTLKGTLRVLAIAVAGSAMPLAAQAAESFSYQYLEVGHQHLEGGQNDDGFYGKGSIELGANTYAAAGVDYLSDDDAHSAAELAVGVNGVFDNAVGLYAQVGAIRTEYDKGKVGKDEIGDTGTRIEAGMRVKLNRQIEAQGSFSKTSVDESPYYDGNTFGIAARYRVNPDLSIGVDYSMQPIADRVQIGLRLDF